MYPRQAASLGPCFGNSLTSAWEKIAEEPDVGIIVTLKPQHPQMKLQPQMRQHLHKLDRAGHSPNYLVWLTSSLINIPTQMWKNYKAWSWIYKVTLSVCVSPKKECGTNWLPSSVSSLIPQRDYFLVSLPWLSTFHPISPLYSLLIFVSFAPGFDTASLLYLSMFFHLTLWYPLDQC
jgi:hypothetical protein